MSRYAPPHDSSPIIDAAHKWVDSCLIADGSVFSDDAVSTLEHYKNLDTFFVQRPDEGSGGFYEKLKFQLEPAPPSARKLMAQLLWALFLFPSNISIKTKRKGIIDTWGFSGELLDIKHPLLADAVLDGIGSAGMGVNANRWRELNFMVAIGLSLKAMPEGDRRKALTDYDNFLGWIESVPRDGNRQFRHMFRYLLFPDRVERMSSNNDRKKVLAAFNVAPLSETRKWSDRQFDDALLSLRHEHEKLLDAKDIDFYNEPLRARWKQENDPDSDETDADESTDQDLSCEREPSYSLESRRAKNLILYGPPGTGKTWALKTHYFKEYTEKAVDVDHTTWLHQLVAAYGWRSVIAAALAGLGKASSVSEVGSHELVAAKSRQRPRPGHIHSTVEGYLRGLSVEDSASDDSIDRNPTHIFRKNTQSQWTLTADWDGTDPASAELYALWKAGQQAMSGDIQRYRVVTFHPSYTYEDFVIGLRPVTQSDGMGNKTVFKMVDGVFKQICADAKANPDKPYALFIDEINRANIAKVFGELITLIEPDKRARYDGSGRLVAGMEVQLPGTSDEEGMSEKFGVPQNLDIIGTMNTADRSIALLDIALRRRFEFQEIAPNYDVIPQKIGAIDLSALLRRINDRIEYLADKNRLIGHAYLVRVGDLSQLRLVFRDQIIPLLQEYFFDDFSQVEQVLSAADGTSPFLTRVTLGGNTLFGPHADTNGGTRTRYALSEMATWTEEAFCSLYGQTNHTEQ
ncbi:AAA family ATPase [Alcaligenaceae bacterium]|nr:AAA family ATPase [Alcaligenaceae bacterium]